MALTYQIWGSDDNKSESDHEEDSVSLISLLDLSDVAEPIVPASVSVNEVVSSTKDTAVVDFRRHRKIPIDFLLNSTIPPISANPELERITETLVCLPISKSSVDANLPSHRVASMADESPYINENEGTRLDVTPGRSTRKRKFAKSRKKLKKKGKIVSKIVSQEHPIIAPPIKPILEPIENTVLHSFQKKRNTTPARLSIVKYIKSIFWGRLQHPSQAVSTDKEVQTSPLTTTDTTEVNEVLILSNPVDDNPSNAKQSQAKNEQMRQTNSKKRMKRRTTSLRNRKYLVKQKRIIRLANSSSSDDSSSSEIESDYEGEYSRVNIKNTSNVLSIYSPMVRRSSSQLFRSDSAPVTPYSSSIHVTHNSQNLTDDIEVISLSDSESSEEPPWPGMFSQVATK